MRTMKMPVYCCAILLAFTSAFTACSGSGNGSSNDDINNNGTTKQENSNTSKQKLEVEALEQALEKKGFEIGEKTEKMYGVIKANDGYGLEINGESIEIYEYNTGITSGEEAIEKMVEDGVMGQRAIRRKNLLMLVEEDHPKWDTIKQTFKGL